MNSKGFTVPRALDVHPLGENGEMEVLPATGDLLSTSQLPFGLPPILPDTNSILESFLTDIEKLPIFHVDAVQRLVPAEPNVQALYEVQPCPLQTELAVKRNMTTGKLLGFIEKVKDSSTGTTKTSTSLSRAPGQPEFGIKGNTSSFPFWPGGIDEPVAKLLSQQPMDTDLFNCDYLTTPPGFKNGLQFERKHLEMDGGVPVKINLADILTMDDLLDLEIPEDNESLMEEEVHLENIRKEVPKAEDRDEDELLHIEELPVLNISEAKIEGAPVTYKWAVIENVSVPVDDFHEKIPNMAFKWDFELDTFQKKAILHLEKQESVFVAAHTSAGKTVVAEYAVALAKKHMTRVLYTSPIKALSNQKFRDFRKSFGNVGLITGDVQINPTGFCLIMTTEILRSMLYHGSDVVREVEWVIFDEVHYINDAERGVVWEEVFIMLPQHVNLIMLSATVPNTAEFAEWLGGVRKRNIYVISTVKRPVPLVYHLYTGSVGKSQNEIFPIIDENKQFLEIMYRKAVAAKASRDTKSKSASGPKGPRHHVTLAQEKNIYIGLLGYLKKIDLLPVVCFTLSRRKCSEYAALLKSQDMTTEKEKSEIRHFFKYSISRLKDDDQKLRQVKTMEDQLLQGFGVHHSGILPILKEVVEMLFQRGLVKVLFATETFAMGVNMPARTVVFDSIQKHDGTEFRNLLPSEFIQMAGRAGRRGLDKTGIVIVLCKGDVPDILSLKNMMLGKPQNLESQFKLTYSMILNLLKVRSLRVEDVIKRSFSESDSEKKREKYQEIQNKSVDKYSKLKRPQCSLCDVDLEQYCKTLAEMRRQKKEVMDKVCAQAVNNKILTVGRVISFTTLFHPNVPGVLLHIDKENRCKVLTAAVKSTSDIQIKPWSKHLFFEDEMCPEVVKITFSDIEAFSNKVLKLDAEAILKEWQKMENMKSSPGHCFSTAFQDFIHFCEASRNGFTESKINFKDISLMQDYFQYRKLREMLEDFKCLKCLQFPNHFASLSEILELQEVIKDCKFKMSFESLQLHSEYQSRKKVLQNLGYIDAEDNVQLKGSVAREMSSHELVITELLVKCVFANCSPEEIAAMLSCMVFQQRPKFILKSLGISPSLLNKIVSITDVIKDIDDKQKREEIIDPNFVDQYNFELTQVVYDWASQTSFAKIMENESIEVEEGIIVRCIQRLSELLKDIRSAAVLIGDRVLVKKMEDASKLIKRDIVFAASLYTQ